MCCNGLIHCACHFVFACWQWSLSYPPMSTVDAEIQFAARSRAHTLSLAHTHIRAHGGDIHQQHMHTRTHQTHTHTHQIRKNARAHTQTLAHLCCEMFMRCVVIHQQFHQ